MNLRAFPLISQSIGLSRSVDCPRSGPLRKIPAPTVRTDYDNCATMSRILEVHYGAIRGKCPAGLGVMTYRQR